MENHFNFDDYSAQIKKTVIDELQKLPSRSAIMAAMANVIEKAEKALDENIDPVGKAHIACRAGCGTCCAVNVGVLLPEALSIADYLVNTLTNEELEQVKKRIDDLFVQTRWLDDGERILIRRSCAFLDDSGSCSIYPVRPLLCRSLTSTDPESCHNALVMESLGESVPVLMNFFQKTLMEVTFESAGEAFDESGFRMPKMELTEALKRLLDNPDSWKAFCPEPPVFMKESTVKKVDSSVSPQIFDR